MQPLVWPGVEMHLSKVLAAGAGRGKRAIRRRVKQLSWRVVVRPQLTKRHPKMTKTKCVMCGTKVWQHLSGLSLVEAAGGAS
jgi:hypothetical protein